MRAKLLMTNELECRQMESETVRAAPLQPSVAKVHLSSVKAGVRPTNPAGRFDRNEQVEGVSSHGTSGSYHTLGGNGRSARRTATVGPPVPNLRSPCGQDT